MKLRPSIRLYFMVAMLLTGSLTVAVMTGTAVNYMFAGMDMAMKGFFRSHALELPLGEGNTPVQIGELTVAASWDDLPHQIRDHLSHDDLEPGEILKYIEGTPILSKPTVGYFVMRVDDGSKVRYISQILTKEDKRHFDKRGSPPYIYIILTGFAAIIIFAGVLFIVQRRVATPVERLKDWAKTLDKEQLTKPAPNFHYSELDTLAKIIQSSLSSVQESLEREQRFLGYASHELRTPIAVTRTNSELLCKMIEKQVPVEKQLAVLDRIERAGMTMTDLTETLLWLNRQEGKSLPSHDLVLGELVTQIESEMHYLLHGKEVDVVVNVDDSEQSLPESLTRIVIANLIRNAFQHTYRGEVIIEQKRGKFSIRNYSYDIEDDIGPSELGFGLGLELTERLISQYGWTYVMSPMAQGRTVEVRFI